MVNPERVLIFAEDDHWTAQLLVNEIDKSTLGVDKIIVLTTRNGVEEFLSRGIIPDNHISLVVFNYYIGDSDCRPYLSRMQNDVRFSSIPFIVLSGTLSDEAESECLDLGAKAFLNKADFASLEQLEKAIKVHMK